MQVHSSPILFIARWSTIDIFSRCLGHKDLYRDYFAHLQKMLIPIAPLPKFDIPEGYISVAVHIRKGDGYDAALSSQQIYKSNANTWWQEENQYQEEYQRLEESQSQPDNQFIEQTEEVEYRTPADRNWPHKFPPEQYYIDQVNSLSELLSNKKLIFYVFSDCKDPEALANRLKQHCKKENIVIINATTPLTESPLIDMFKMAACDCLIRPQSAYSIVSQIIGTHKVVCSPTRSEWRNNRLCITQVMLTLYDDKKNNSIELPLESYNADLIKQWFDKLFVDKSILD